MKTVLVSLSVSLGDNKLHSLASIRMPEQTMNAEKLGRFILKTINGYPGLNIDIVNKIELKLSQRFDMEIKE